MRLEGVVLILLTFRQVPKLERAASRVWKADNAIHQITLYPVNNEIGFANTYPPDSDLSGE